MPLPFFALKRAAVVFAVLGGIVVRPGFVESPVLNAPPRITLTETVQAKPRTDPMPVLRRPYRLVIPSINVDAPVEHIGLLQNGQLDVPQAIDAAGWYRLGPLPGEVGSAVIDGHLDIGRNPGVFWNLKHVKPGDRLYTVDANGKRQVFRVEHTAIYHVNDAPMEQIFARKDARRLNLITCAGAWDKKLGHYDRRLIVYTKMIETSDQL